MKFKNDAYNLDEDVEALVNTVNCVGVMGRGVALKFKKKYRKNYKDYREACKKGQVKPGLMHIHDFELGRLPIDPKPKPRYIINFPTKRHWRSPSKIADIESGLKDLAKQIQELQIQSIAIPALGCGNGGLDWPEVRKLIETELHGVTKKCEILVFEPGGEKIQNLRDVTETEARKR